ncbi:hypothetical protein BH23ACT4_BH23ACT4_14350 [soil metagenome]
MPLSLSFIVVTTVVLGLFSGRARRGYLRLLITTTVLTLLVGTNLSALGLIDFAGDSILPMLEFFGLIVLLDVVYAFSFAYFARNHPSGGWR